MIDYLRSHPIATGIFGSLSGWISVDLLRAAQFFAGITAGFASVLTIIIIAPKAWEQLSKWHDALSRRSK